jgi:hypothetical protein
VKTRALVAAHAGAFAAAALATHSALHAEPYLAVQQGYRCAACHASATGGGLRTEFGNVYAQNVLAAHRLDLGAESWTGTVSKHVAIGGNLRGGWAGARVEGQDSSSEFDVTEGRLYLQVQPIPGRLALYVDERVAPGTADNLESYAKYSNARQQWFVRAGKFYLPFGLRLEDDSAFTRQMPGLNMATPDTGVETGWESERWSAQLAVSNGSGGGPETDDGKRFTGQLVYVHPAWRLGVAASHNSSDAGDRTAYALFGGLKTGPIAWLGEFDFVTDDGFSTGTRDLMSGLLEANWQPRQGHNVKLTGEWLDADADVDEDEQVRWSLVYEYSPIPFLQLRGGARAYDGIPQNALQNREEYFVELHGYF